MRCSLIVVGIFVAFVTLSDAAVVQRRYRNTEEILVPVAVIQDGEVFPEIQQTSSQLKAVDEDIPQAVDEEQIPQEVVAEAAEQAQRRIDNDILEEEIQEVVEEEKKELLKEIKEKEIQVEQVKEEVLKPEVLKPEVLKPEEQPQELKEPITEEIILLSDIVPNVEDAIKEKQPTEQIKSLVEKESTEEEASKPLIGVDDQESSNEGDGGNLRQATQATPTTTQQNFVQQLIQNSPLGQFFNQISGQNNQGVANEDAPATPAPTIPGFLAPAITAAQNVVNTTSNAFQGLQQFASNLGNQFQNTLSSLGGQPVQQNAGGGAATTPRPQGPFQQLVSTFMGNNNQQGTPAPSQGPLQGLLNIFQGNNNNNNRPQVNDASANIVEADPAKQPDIVTELASSNADDEISNDIRSSDESNDSFEEVVQPEEMIVVQDDASQTQSDSEQV